MEYKPVGVSPPEQWSQTTISDPRMERLFYQSEWQGISFHELSGTYTSGVAGREFYSLFYHSLLSRNAELSPKWIEQKQNIGRWLATEFLEAQGIPKKLHVFSVGAGLGIVEGWLWEHGYCVDVLECEPYSLASLKKRIPEIRCVIGDARCIPCRSSVYDLVYMSGVDYSFDRCQYRQVLAEMGRLTKPDGKVVSVCISNLSLKGIIKGSVKSLLDQTLGKTRGSKGEIPWGYQRTVGEHVEIGRAAGLLCQGMYLFDHAFNLVEVRRPGLLRMNWSTIRDCIVAVSFRRVMV